MTSKEDSRTSGSLETRPSEVEVAQLLQEAEQQYEECMRLADLADVSETGEVSHPRYAWDNPLGLVVGGQTNAKLV